MNQISLTVPMDYNALTRASDMLNGLAIDLKREGPVEIARGEEAVDERVPGVKTADEAPDLSGASVAVISPDPASVAASQPAEQIEEPTAQQVFATQQQALINALKGDEEDAPAGVELAPSSTNPEVLIPWDARIHSKGKTTLAKKPHGWKLKRNLDPTFVAQVEAELAAAMAVSSPNAGAPGAGDPSAPAAPPAPQVVPQATAAAAAPPVSTLPELIAKITAAKIPAETVTEALNKQGLASLPLLGARPDLIPAVAAELFPGG